MRSWLAWLVDAEVRRLRTQLDQARHERRKATRTALRWYRADLIDKARADAHHTEETP